MFLDPIVKGTYPETIPPEVDGSELSATAKEMKLIKGTLDFMGVNHYSRSLVSRSPDGSGFAKIAPSYPGLACTDMGWEIFPAAMYATLVFLKREYGDFPVFVTENGMACRDTETNGKIEDRDRVNFLRDNILMMNRAMQDGCNVQGYFVWSLMDNFEWAEGYTKRFGIVYVDYKTQKRIIKESGKWYSRICKGEINL
jgi:beta-glucosidase